MKRYSESRPRLHSVKVAWLTLLLGGFLIPTANAEEKVGSVEQYGSMHETIG